MGERHHVLQDFGTHERTWTKVLSTLTGTWCLGNKDLAESGGIGGHCMSPSNSVCPVEKITNKQTKHCEGM